MEKLTSNHHNDLCLRLCRPAICTASIQVLGFGCLGVHQQLMSSNHLCVAMHSGGVLSQLGICSLIVANNR